MIAKDKKRKQETEPEKPSFDALLQADEGYQAAFEVRVNEAIQAARADWEQESKPEADPEENDTQLQLDQEREALESEKKAFARQRMEIAVGQELQKRGLAAAFAPWLTGETPEKSAENIDTFEVLFQEALSDAVTSRMRGTGAPREPNRPRSYSREELRGMSRREINAHWAEIQHTLTHC